MKKACGLLAILFIIILTCSVNAATLTVCSSGCNSTTIQGGIDAATAGDTINVSAGTYNENQIIINKSVSVIGDDRDTIIIDGGDAVLTSTGLVRITAGDDVLFSNFTLKNAGGPAVGGGDGGDDKLNVGVYAQSDSSSAVYTIINIKIIGTDNPDDEEDYGLYSHGGKEKLVFTNNEIVQTGANPILIERHTGETEISSNMLDVGVWGSTTIFYMTYANTSITTLQNVSYNIIDMGSGGPFDEGHACSAISFSGSYRNPPGTKDLENGKYTNIEITDNTIKNLQPYRRGIALANMDPNGEDGKISDAQILRNILIGSSAVETKGIRLAGLIDNANIQNNIIKNVDKSFYGQNAAEFAAGATDYPTGTKINKNSFENNAEGLVWEGSEILDATYNYWGSCDGPSGAGSGHGDAVSAHVNYSPWIGVCVDNNETGGNCAFETDSLILKAGLNGTGIKSCWLSYKMNGTNYNKSASIIGNECRGVVSSSELVGGMDLAWNFYADDSFGKIYNGSWENSYIRKRTYLGVSPWPADGENGWHVTEPKFNLIKDGLGTKIYYQWDSSDIFLYDGGIFGLENIPNSPPKESAGILELNWWADFGSCGNEPEQNLVFKVDLTVKSSIQLNIF